MCDYLTVPSSFGFSEDWTMPDSSSRVRRRCRAHSRDLLSLTLMKVMQILRNTGQQLHFNERYGGDVESAINMKGQATIPKAIREHLGLKPGDRVKLFVHPDVSVVLLPKVPVAALR